MNQDSEQNDSRDGNDRSSGRRDDDRNDGARPRFNRSNDTDKPRFGRDNDRNAGDRPRFNRSNDTDKPRFGRDNDRRPDGPPRFERDKGDRPNRPFNDRADRRPDDRRENSPYRGNRDRNEQRPGSFGNRDERPRRNDGPRNDGPRSDRFGNDRPRNDGPNRFGRDGDAKPRFDRSNDRPRNDGPNRFGRDGDAKPRFDRSNDRPRNDGPNRFSERPDDRRRPDNRPDEPRRFNREGFDKPRDTDRPDRFNRDRPDRRTNDRPDRSERPSRFSRDERPAFERVGGFNREADERNRDADRASQDGNNRPTRNVSEDRSTDGTSRFSPEQRKESGERRTGRYEKAPNYNIEQAPFRGRERDSRPTDGRDKSKPDRPGASESGETRLNRYIANSGVCSRREADELIARGDISVNGKVITEMGFRVKPGDTVKYGTKVLNPERFVYVLLNKPKDYITTTDDPEERRTVMELVADAGNFRIYPVGRLDRNTTGLLLLTNDGELADKLTHPSNNIRKIYQVEIDKPITNEDFETIQQGITLDDGPIKPDAISIITPDAQVVGIEIHSGRNRIVRRMFESLGYEVTKLDRTSFAGLTKKELPRGKWRFLDPKEVVKLKYFNV